MCVIFQHEDFGRQLIWALQHYVSINIESQEESFFNHQQDAAAAAAAPPAAGGATGEEQQQEQHEEPTTRTQPSPSRVGSAYPS